MSQVTYTCTTEETHFNGGGHRAKIVRSDGGTSYLGGTVFKTVEEAMNEAALVFAGAKSGFHY